MSVLNISTPLWAVPLKAPSRYKGAKGGRGGGKSHHFAYLLIRNHLNNPHHRTVCIREVQKSLKHSSKKTIEDKIQSLGLGAFFIVQDTCIKNVHGSGIIIFTGLSDQTAESIKSLEGFDTAFIDEAHTISHKSLEILLPTIRKPKSEIWFSWNPRYEDDAVEEFFKMESDDKVLVEVNFTDNPFISEEIVNEAERHRVQNPDTYDHVWLGKFSIISEAQIFKGKFEVKDFEINEILSPPLFGLDFGFSQDPTAGVKVFVSDNVLYIRNEAGKVGLELDDTAQYLSDRIPSIENHTIRADSARPESISHLKRRGLPFIEGVEKWSGSVQDGIAHMKSYDKIIIHTECVETAKEFRLYSYKVDKRTGDILPTIEDKHNHFLDGIRYALSPIIRDGSSVNYALLC